MIKKPPHAALLPSSLSSSYPPLPYAHIEQLSFQSLIRHSPSQLFHAGSCTFSIYSCRAACCAAQHRPNDAGTGWGGTQGGEDWGSAADAAAAASQDGGESGLMSMVIPIVSLGKLVVTYVFILCQLLALTNYKCGIPTQRRFFSHRTKTRFYNCTEKEVGGRGDAERHTNPHVSRPVFILYGSTNLPISRPYSISPVLGPDFRPSTSSATHLIDY
jgi:hypothetical protein